VAPAYFRRDDLVITSDGDVEDFDPKVIEVARKEVAERVSFWARHCQKVGCDNCTLPACPVSDQG